jgi:Coenzyme A transferase
MQTISLERSVEMIPDGASLMIGGFVAVGTPERVVDELVRHEKRDLTVIANDTAIPDRGIGKLIADKYRPQSRDPAPDDGGRDGGGARGAGSRVRDDVVRWGDPE